MGILDKLFGSSSNQDDKWVMYIRMSMALAHVDGETTKDEVDGAIGRLLVDKGVSADRIPSILERAKDQTFDEALENAKSLNDDERIELLNHLIGNAHDDGYFHGEEVVFIAYVGAQIGLNPESLIAHMMTHETYKDVDPEEVTKAMEKFID